MSTSITVQAGLMIERVLSLEIVRVTEAAALAASKLMGRGNEKAADQAAVDAMRQALTAIEADGVLAEKPQVIRIEKG